MPGLGTLINVVAIIIGAGLGVLVGHRLPERTRTTVTDSLGLVTGVIGALNVIAVTNASFQAEVGAPLLVVLGALLIGGIIGSLLDIEHRMEALGGWLQGLATRRRRADTADVTVNVDARARFIEGFVDASLLFCIGPLAIIGPITDGLGQGIEQLALKSTLDGFASLAFAATLGWGVAASALSVAVFQGIFTVVGIAAGAVASAAVIASITATGGILLLGVSLRLLRIKEVAVANLLPALVVAPILTVIVGLFR